MADTDTSLQQSENAIQAAVRAARDLGFVHRAVSLFDDGDAEDQASTHRDSFTLTLEGVTSALHAGELERLLNDLPGVHATVVYGETSTAWLSVPTTTAPQTIIDFLADHDIGAEKRVSSLYRRIDEAERAAMEPQKRLSWRTRRWARRRRTTPQALLQRAHHLRVQPQDSMEVLFTARELLTHTRLIISIIFTVPVVVISLMPQWQFPWWQWVSAALATPVVWYCAWPFHRAALGGLRRGLAALDSATSLAIMIAYLWSLAALVFLVPDPGWTSPPAWIVFQGQPQIFFDVATMATTLVLIGRLMSRRNRLQGMRLMSSHDVNPDQVVTVIRKVGTENVKQSARVAELHLGEYILVGPGDVIPVDGTVVGGSSLISPGPVSGHRSRAVVKVNDRIFAGGRNMGDTLKIRVDRSGHTTRLAAMHRWVEACDEAEHRSTRAATRSASLLVPWTIVLAVVAFLIWFLITEDASGAIATALAVLTGVGPVALAISTTMASRLGLARATSEGLLFRDEQALWELADCDLVLFNRVGALTTGKMQVESVTAATGENPDLILRVAGALAMESDHAVSQALVRAARESRDRGAGGSSVPHWIEVTNEHVTSEGSFVGTVEIPIKGELTPVKAALWRPRDLSELEDERLALAAVSGGTPLVVSWKNKTRGVITVLDATRDDAAEAVERLEALGITTGMLSRDTYPVARRAADILGISTVLAGVGPSRKTSAVRSLHRQGYKVALVGDPDLMNCLAVADVGILVGAADCLNQAEGSVVVLRDEVNAVPDAVNLARRVKSIGSGNMAFSWVYNVAALTLSALGVMNPLLSTALMLVCAGIIEWRTLSLRGNRLFGRLRQSV